MNQDTANLPADPFADAEIISIYLVSDGVADGTMVDAGELAQECGYRLPVVLTRAAWRDAVEWDTSRPRAAMQDETGRLWDVLWMLRGAARAAVANPGQRYRFSLLRVKNRTPSGRLSMAELPTTLRLDVVAQAFDRSGRPCLTVLLPGED